MSKRQALMVIGVWVMAVLFLGFPSYLDKIFSVIAGLLIIIISSSFRPPSRPSAADRLTYVEHKSPVSPVSTNDSAIAEHITNTTDTPAS